MIGTRQSRLRPLLLGAAALLPAIAVRAPATAQDRPGETGAQRFAPPLGPMLLTRTLRKPLGDGHEVVTRRSYEIRFVPEAGGFRVEGRPVGVEVDAPPDLAMFAQLERARTDTGLFPMRLDATGQFIPEAAAQVRPGPAAASGGALAHGMIAKAGLSEGDAAQARAFVDLIRSQPARTEWPQDLFRPASGRRIERREVPLPDGMKGSVTIQIDARTGAGDTLLASLDRTVTTDLGGSVRLTYESWTLAPKS